MKKGELKKCYGFLRGTFCASCARLDIEAYCADPAAYKKSSMKEKMAWSDENGWTCPNRRRSE